MTTADRPQDRRVIDDIRDHGWHCLHVLPGPDGEAGFSYSIGFQATYNAPEVMVFGLQRSKAQALLSECAQLLAGGHQIHTDVEDAAVLDGGYKVIFRPVRADCHDDYLGTAVRHYGEQPLHAVVMFLPDKAHRFAWHPDYDDAPSDEALAIVLTSAP
jgi:hypothetical protein